MDLHNLPRELCIVVRESVIRELWSVWLTTYALEGIPDPHNKWARQGICIGDEMTYVEAEGAAGSYRKQLNLSQSPPFIGAGI